MRELGMREVRGAKEQGSQERGHIETREQRSEGIWEQGIKRAKEHENEGTREPRERGSQGSVVAREPRTWERGE